MIQTDNSSGIVRRMDDLGRLCIPREMRRTMNTKEGDPFELSIMRIDEDMCFVAKPYRPAEGWMEHIYGTAIRKLICMLQKNEPKTTVCLAGVDQCGVISINGAPTECHLAITKAGRMLYDLCAGPNPHPTTTQMDGIDIFVVPVQQEGQTICVFAMAGRDIRDEHRTLLCNSAELMEAFL